MQNRVFLSLVVLSLLIFSCNNQGDELTEKIYSITGIVQKGPFINGSDITISELDNQFHPTGRTFHTTTGSSGQFESIDITLISPYIELIADGFFYNEVAGTLSNEKISLKAIVNLSDQEVININVLTNLEHERVKQLISTSETSIEDAIDQAQEELLSIFSLDSFQIDNPESLDIIESGKGDAILLAISAILQGNHTTAELSKIMADIVTDMKEDGILNDTLIQNTLLGQALTLNTDQIKLNMIDIYQDLGVDIAQVNNFDEYVNYFITHSAYHYSTPFEYPASTSNGPNVLLPDLLKFQLITGYSFAVDMPGAGKITIKMTRIQGQGIWWYQPTHTYGWNVSQYNLSTNEQFFTSTLNDVTIDLPMEFSENGKALIEYYYNGSETPSMTKTISWGAENNTDFIFPGDSPAGLNLLNISDSSEIVGDSTYTVGLRKPGSWDVNFTLVPYYGDVTFEIMGGWGNYTYDEIGGGIQFTLSGKNDGDYISEIIIKVIGEGAMTLTSDDLEIQEGAFLARLFYVN